MVDIKLFCEDWIYKKNTIQKENNNPINLLKNFILTFRSNVLLYLWSCYSLTTFNFHNELNFCKAFNFKHYSHMFLQLIDRFML